MTDKEDPVVLRFRGDGTARIPGVPMRDLTGSDVKEIAPDALREAMASPLYDIVTGARLPLNRSAVTEPEAPPEEPPTELPPTEPDAPSGDAGKGQGKTAKGGE